MEFTRKIYETRNEKTLDFVIGFLGWFVFTLILQFAANLLLPGGRFVVGLLSGNDTDIARSLDTVLPILALAINCLPLILNILVLIYFAFTRYWIALGALFAFGALLLIVLLLAAGCFALSSAPYS